MPIQMDSEAWRAAMADKEHVGWDPASGNGDYENLLLDISAQGPLSEATFGNDSALLHPSESPSQYPQQLNPSSDHDQGYSEFSNHPPQNQTPMQTQPHAPSSSSFNHLHSSSACPNQAQDQLQAKDATGLGSDSSQHQHQQQPPPLPSWTAPVSSPPPSRLTIVVSAPLQATTASSLPGVTDNYWFYPITTSTSLPNWSAPTVMVQRRFRDFVALSDTLSLSLPGYFLPCRPHRNALQSRRATPRFMEERRSALERYLNRLASHEAVGSSEALKVFLEAQGPLLQSPAWAKLQPVNGKGLFRSTTRLLKQLLGQEPTACNPREVTQSAYANGDMYRLMREQIAALQGLTKLVPVTPLESELREEAFKIEETRRALVAMCQKADVLVEKLADEGAALQELGKSFQALLTYEETFARSAMPQILGPATEGLLKMGKLKSLSADHSARHLSLMHDNLGALPVAQAALGHRERALLTSLTVESELSRKRVLLEQAAVAGPSAFGRRQALEDDVSLLGASLQAARENYTKLSERNADEVVAWRARLKEDITNLTREFVLVQIASAQKSQQIWTETAAALRG